MLPSQDWNKHVLVSRVSGSAAGRQMAAKPTCYMPHATHAEQTEQTKQTK